MLPAGSSCLCTRAAPKTIGPAPPLWEENRHDYLGAVGESQYQPALRRVARNGRVCWTTVMREPENLFLFDLNAVAVCESIAERWITCRRRSPYGKRKVTVDPSDQPF